MSVLRTILPRYSDHATLDRRAAEINSYFVAGEIGEGERDQLLADLVRTAVIAEQANEQERKILLDQCVKVLSMVPIP
jgi:hypothetical protein